MIHCSGETCLHQAATAGQLDSVKMLLAAGANPDLQCAKSGKTGEDIELVLQTILWFHNRGESVITNLRMDLRFKL